MAGAFREGVPGTRPFRASGNVLLRILSPARPAPMLAQLARLRLKHLRERPDSELVPHLEQGFAPGRRTRLKQPFDVRTHTHRVMPYRRA